VLTTVLAAAAIVAPLIGVWVGAQLSDRSSEDAWLRDQRLAAYLELLDQFEALIRMFAVGQRVSRFRPEAAEHAHDFEGVELAWMDATRDLTHTEMRISILGGKLGQIYESHANDLLADMFDALEDKAIDEAAWDKLVARGHAIHESLEKSARDDLKVPIARPRPRLTHPLRRARLSD